MTWLKKLYIFMGQKGFSLVELMVVLALIGILAGMAIPGILENLPKYRLNSGARQVMTDIQYARGRAASLNREYKIQFFVDTDKYHVLQGDKSMDSSAWTLEKEETALADDGVDMVSVSSNPVWFKPTGTMAGTTITLQNTKGESLNIKTSTVGRVKKQ